MSESHPARLLSFPQLGDAPPASKARALIFSDPQSHELRRQLDRVASSGAPVLIVGETGTGKELAARYIHEHSRVSGPFVAVNCGAFSEGLVDAELFGHEAGAYTGAQHARAGWFETANGGTLFLDEIGDMPMALQVKLLRILQERQVVRLGSRKPIPVDVRVVAATNVELESAIEAKDFRQDLYYRLAVASVHILPLRDRRADILPLARHFVELYQHKLGLEHARLSAAAEQAMLDYDWPGNIRELENVVHFGLIVSRGGLIEASDLRLRRRAPVAPVAAAAAGAAAGAAVRDAGGRPDARDARDALDALGQGLRRLLGSDRQSIYEDVERLLLTTAFEYCQGNQVHTARRLGVSRNIVRAQLKRFGLLGREHSADIEEPSLELA